MNTKEFVLSLPLFRHHMLWGMLASALLLTACGGGSSSSDAPSGMNSTSNFVTGQAATVVIGQEQLDLGEPNQGGTADLTTLYGSSANPLLHDGVLYVADTGNNRVLIFEQGIPDVNGASASFILGQSSDSGTSPGLAADRFYWPNAMLVHDGKFLLSDRQNNRVLIWNQLPTGNVPADIVLGQSNMSSNTPTCAASGMDGPGGLIIVDGKLVVSDIDNNRLLVWNTFPTVDGQAADAVIGQDNLTSCISNRGTVTVSGTGFDTPTAIWSDGSKLAVPDMRNHRILLWNSWPGTGENTVPADVVIGQPNLSSSSVGVSSGGLNQPEAVAFDGTNLFVSDSANDRVMIWHGWPSKNGTPADVALGQQDTESALHAFDPAADVFSYPIGLLPTGGKLLVADTSFNRILIFE